MPLAPFFDPASATPWQTAVLLAWVPLVALIHEAGHACMARPAGYRLASFGVGRGRPLLRHRGQGGTLYYLGRWIFAGGACVAVPRSLTPGPQAALFHAGGALAQLLLALLLWVLPSFWWTQPVASFNWIVLLWNLIPWRFGGMASDGWWLLALARGGGAGPGLLLARRPQIERILDFEETTGSPVGTWYARLMLAWMDLQVGRIDAADGFFTREHAEAVVDPELDALQDALTAEWHRQRGRPLAALWVVRGLRRARGSGLSENGDGMLSLVESRTLRDLGELRAAREALARLAGAEGPLAADAALSRLEMALLEGNLAEIELAADRLLDRGRGGDLAPATVARALWAAGEQASAGGHAEVGRRYGRAARQQAARILAAAQPADRASLARLLGEVAGLRPSPVSESA
jgi:hypothetical protein